MTEYLSHKVMKVSGTKQENLHYHVVISLELLLSGVSVFKAFTSEKRFCLMLYLT